ncbi:MAG: TldD/PmbA family protein [Clostridiales bacterium]|nr:TldD/PmbA family protein [Clostridiales bacterium]
MDNQIRKYIDDLLKAAEKEGFVESEVYYESDVSMSVAARERKISQFECSDAAGLSFRGLYNGQMGYAYTEDIHDEMIPFLLSQAKDNCGVLEVKEKITVYEGDKEYPTFESFTEELTSLDYDSLSKMALEMEGALLDYDPRIQAVDDCYTMYNESELYIKNSKGMLCEARTNSFDVYLGCRAKENDDVQTYGKSWCFCKLSEFSMKDCVEKVGKRVIAKLGAAPVPSVKTSIVLDQSAATSLLAAFAGAFSAESMHKGLSRLAGRIGETIANEKVTLIDEGMIEDSPFCIPFDSEGVAAKRTVLIDKGVFTSALHNRKTALVDGLESTGNGFRGGPKGALGISSTNLHFENGDMTQEELFAKMKDGILITAIHGLHAGINGISGEFSLMSEGFEIKDGKVGKPINQITIADNFFDILMKVEALGNDVDYHSPERGHTQSPSLLIPDVSVAGE